jgi:hypothetical protein
MPEDIDNLNDDSDEGVRALRARLKEEAAARKVAEEQLAARNTADEQAAAEAHATAVAAEFKQFGLSENMAKLYPADGAADADSIAEWASNYGLSVRKEEVAEPSILDRYNQVVAGAWNNQSNTDDLGSRIIKGVMEARNKKTIPTQEERDDAEILMNEVNRRNRELEQEVLRGNAQPFGADGVAAYGGLLQPPVWANYTLEANKR